ncbi:MAG: hypothetical protein SFU56_20590 [Capsulimonadales bacterium]|nr:hypothetical protein [Capsulimonadales bacterium]
MRSRFNPTLRFGLWMVLVIVASAGTLAIVSASPKQTPQEAFAEFERIEAARRTDGLFHDDPALNRPFRMAPRVCRMDKLLQVAGKMSKRTLGTGSSELVYVAAEKVPVRAVMEAVAAVYQLGWRRDSPTEYTLIRNLALEYDFIKHSSEEQKIAFAAGEHFFRHFDQLSSKRKFAMLNPESPDQMVNVRELPEPMQDFLEQMVDAINRHTYRSQEKEGVKTPRGVPSAEVRQAKIKIEPGNFTSFRSYFVRLDGPTGFNGFAIFLKQPPMRHEGKEGVEHDSEADTPPIPIREFPDTRPIYRPEEPSVREENKKRKAFDRKGTIRGGEMTLINAIRRIRETYQVPVLAHIDSFDGREKVQRTFQVKDLPLREALDRLADLYGDNRTKIRWYPGRYGVLVLRGDPVIPEHP